MTDDSPAGEAVEPDRPGLGDRRSGARLRRWEMVIIAVALVIVVVAAVAT
jgi:hypothetical protein